MSTPIGQDEFSRGVESLRRELHAGLDAIVLRLDRINGRIDRHDDQITTLISRVAQHEDRLHVLLTDHSARLHDAVIIPVTPRVVLALILATGLLVLTLWSMARGWWPSG